MLIHIFTLNNIMQSVLSALCVTYILHVHYIYMSGEEINHVQKY